METHPQTYAPPLPAHLDFDQLRDLALARLQALSGEHWTDYNAHDPGVTLLEALCYALTDLGYRAGYPVADWLAEGDGGASLPGPEVALPSPPVSAVDWRRLLSADAGNRYARLQAPDESKAPAVLYYTEEEGGALSNVPDPGARAVPLRGLLQALLGDSKTINAHRGLGTDYAGNQNVSPLPLFIELDVEVTAEMNSPAALRELGRQLAGALREAVEMPPRFQTPAQRVAAGASPDDVYEGPLLSQGIPVEGGRPDVVARKALYVSDLVGAVAAVPGVRLLQKIAVNRTGGGASGEWVLPLSADVHPYIDSFFIQLFSGSTMVLKFSGPQPPETAPVPAGVPTPPAQAGRRRRMDRYHSIRHHLPAVYGLDADTSANPARARQLSAYLLFFEQILANAFSTLGETARLFSPGSDDWDKPAFRLLNDIPGASGVWASGAETLAETWESPEYGTRRRLRLLEHWLARFGETLPHIPDNPDELQDDSPAESLQEQQTLVNIHRAFWKTWPALSARRGLGCDTSKPDDISGVEQRITALLGLRENERIYLVEHILLRPLPDHDVPDERGFLLTHVPNPDPYSLRVTVVYRKDEGRFRDSAFLKVFVQTVREEIPAHLTLNLKGLDMVTQGLFHTYWQQWRAALADQTDSYRFRVCRDAVIDFLYEYNPGDANARFLLGWPVPILDLPVPKDIMVAPGAPATIELKNAQPNVQYQLYDRDGLLPVQAAQSKDIAGNIIFTTATLSEDTVFRIMATKSLPGLGPTNMVRQGLLTNRILVRVGVRTDNLGIRLEQSEINFGAIAAVIIDQSQAEVQYQLIRANGTALSAVVAGNATQPIRLETTAGLNDDTEIRVRATRLNQSQDINQPGLVYVRPNPGLGVQIANPVLDYNAEARVVVANAQAGVSYRLYYREIADYEIIHKTGAEPGELGIPLTGGLPAVRLDAAKAVAAPRGWNTMVVVENAAPGVNLTLPGVVVREDTWFRVEALKRHADGHQHQPVFLSGISAVVVRPNPAIEATLLTPQPAAGSIAEVELKNVQSGVSYQLTQPDGATGLGMAEYVHDTGAESPRRDGIGDLVVGRSSGMKIGVDFAIGPNQPSQSVRLASGPLNPAPASMRVLARKIQTGLSIVLAATLTLTPPPAGRQAAAPAPDAESPKPRAPRKPRKP